MRKVYIREEQQSHVRQLNTSQWTCTAKSGRSVKYVAGAGETKGRRRTRRCLV
jgi:hypothetical protein